MHNERFELKPSELEFIVSEMRFLNTIHSHLLQHTELSHIVTVLQYIKNTVGSKEKQIRQMVLLVRHKNL